MPPPTGSRAPSHRVRSPVPRRPAPRHPAAPGGGAGGRATPRQPARPPGPRREPQRKQVERRGGLLWRWRRPLFLLALAGFGVVAGGMYYLSHLPLPKLAPLSQTSFVYDSQGHLLTTYQQENRTDVKLTQVPQVVIDAVVSTEDRNFFHEGAIDPLSEARALFNDLFGSGGLQGGSTITQQYVKQAYLTPQRSITRKLKEALLALQVERHESKDTILQNYLNTIYFGRGAYGIQAAAETYFGKPVGQLGLAEASLLAGMIRDPVDSDPSTHPTVARAHQDDTLTAMLRDHQINAAAADQVRAAAFSSYVLSPSQSGVSTAQTPGVDYFLDAVHQQLLNTYGAAALRRGGLEVTTTLDPTLQTEAYNAVYGTGPDALNPAKGTPSGALVSINDSGNVVALVGGQNYSTSQVDLALGTGGGGSGRQPGSTFKAFMLAELIKSGYSVQSTFPAPPEVVVPHGDANGNPWTVTNFEGEAASDTETVLDATVYSINTVYAQIVERLGASSLDTMAESLGIDPAELQGAYPSQVLGSADVSPLEMAAAYATFADGGVYHSPVLIAKVIGPNGQALTPPKSTTRRVLTTDQAATETEVLEQVIQSGTGTAAGGVGSEVAGKTGTTDSSADAWFIGYTPNLTTALWMGYSTGEIPMVNFRGLASVQGGTIPAAIWHDYMTVALRSEPKYVGTFPYANLYGGETLSPPAAGTIQFPEGLGSTTTSSSTTTTSTTVAGSATTTGTSANTETGTTSPTTRPPEPTTVVTTPRTIPPFTSTTPAAGAGPPTTVAGVSHG